MSRRCREVVIATHPAFEQLSETYKYFREYSSFLYTGIVHKLRNRVGIGYIDSSGNQKVSYAFVTFPYVKIVKIIFGTKHFNLSRIVTLTNM